MCAKVTTMDQLFVESLGNDDESSSINGIFRPTRSEVGGNSRQSILKTALRNPLYVRAARSATWLSSNNLETRHERRGDQSVRPDSPTGAEGRGFGCADAPIHSSR